MMLAPLKRARSADSLADQGEIKSGKNELGIPTGVLLEDIKQLRPPLRVKRVVVKGEARQAAPFSNRFIAARTAGIRHEQINAGAPTTAKAPVATKLLGWDLVMQEVKEKRLPFLVYLPMPDGTDEEWRFDELDDIDNEYAFEKWTP